MTRLEYRALTDTTQAGDASKWLMVVSGRSRGQPGGGKTNPTLLFMAHSEFRILRKHATCLPGPKERQNGAQNQNKGPEIEEEKNKVENE